MVKALALAPGHFALGWLINCNLDWPPGVCFPPLTFEPKPPLSFLPSDLADKT